MRDEVRTGIQEEDVNFELERERDEGPKECNIAAEEVKDCVA